MINVDKICRIKEVPPTKPNECKTPYWTVTSGEYSVRVKGKHRAVRLLKVIRRYWAPDKPSLGKALEDCGIEGKHRTNISISLRKLRLSRHHAEQQRIEANRKRDKPVSWEEVRRIFREDPESDPNMIAEIFGVYPGTIRRKTRDIREAHKARREYEESRRAVAVVKRCKSMGELSEALGCSPHLVRRRLVFLVERGFISYDDISLFNSRTIDYIKKQVST